MAHPIVNYKGEDITCYPGSNQQDEGKLNLEYNMARLVTRVSSKNFCVVKPSFELSLKYVELNVPPFVLNVILTVSGSSALI